MMLDDYKLDMIVEAIESLIGHMIRKSESRDPRFGGEKFLAQEREDLKLAISALLEDF